MKLFICIYENCCYITLHKRAFYGKKPERRIFLYVKYTTERYLISGDRKKWA